MLTLAGFFYACPSAMASGPFHALELGDAVRTSGDGFALWISVVGTSHTVTLPEPSSPLASPSHGVALHAECRAEGSPSLAGTPAHAGLFLSEHPDQPDAHLVSDPMYWLLKLAGKHESHWPVQVIVAGGVPAASTLLRRLTDYSAPRPGLDVALPAGAVVDAFVRDSAVRIVVTGPGTAFDGTFAVPEYVRRAAFAMRQACPASVAFLPDQ